MCDGCDTFFRSKRGVIRAAAVNNVNKFTQVSDLISDIQYRVLQWKRRTDDYMQVSNGFFYTIAQNLAIDCKRQRSRQVQYDEDKHEALLTEQVSLETEATNRARELLQKVMDEIESKDDQDALFSFLADEPIPAIAERLGISRNAASVRRRRAIERAASKFREGKF